MSVIELTKNPPDGWTNLYAQSFNTNTLNPIANPLNINGAINAVNNAPIINPNFGFTAANTNGATGACIFLIQDNATAFNDATTSVLRINAPNSISLGGGVNFITCLNGAATGATAGTGFFANDVVFNVASDGRTTAFSFTQISSKDYKTELKTLTINSENLRDIKPKTYRYKHEPDHYPKRAGLLYEDMLKMCPEACVEDHLGKHIDLHAENAVLFAIIKDLEARIAKLERN